ncbi:pilus assembly PilX N-terminal domain-containing protein [Thalassotalea atypica]|uniref:pilus assembly PilX N-terminal domain-containing protein n=1 Tax=Thalassotalea atypica TaxID=2054316 RepID=UPI0025746D90|nr:pilus assembly PilX N-terminal domain-containing protein [Thalassotalea atypica]
MAIMNKQKGVVLITALVFLVALTAVASAIMLNTSTDIKMSGASEEKLIAQQAAISAVDETIADQVTSGNNLFTGQIFPQPVNSVTMVNVSDITITNRNNNNTMADCSHSRLASSNELIKCNVLNITVNNNYGRLGSSNVNVDAGISQQLLNVGN